MRALNGIFSGYIPAAVTFVASTSRPENLSQNIGIVNTASAVGAISGPLIGGILAKIFGIRGSLIVTAFLLAIAGILPYATGVKEPPVERNSRSIRESIVDTLKNQQLFVIFMSGLSSDFSTPA